MAKKKDDNEQLRSTIDRIQKTFGSDSISIYGEREPEDVPVIPTGSINLNFALGVGGMPLGRISEIFGPEGSGKTTVALHCIAEAQKMGYVAAFIDAEHALDPKYANNIGVDMDSILLSQPDSGEEALEIVEALTRSDQVKLIVIDSVAALTPQAELDGEMGDAHMALQARMMSQAMRKLRGAAKKNNCHLLFINQVREKIGVMFGNPETTPGGRALKFYSSIRMRISGTSKIENAGENIGKLTKVKVIKNKVAPPFKECEFNIIFGKGIDYWSEILNLGIELCVIEKKGSWYRYDGDVIAQGSIGVLEYWEDNPKEFKKVEDEVNKILEE